MYQQWLQIIGLMLDGLGFGLIALEWYRGYREMRKKVDLVARNMEQAEKIRLRNEIKQAIGMAGVGEVEALYKDDKTLAEMAEHAFEIDQVDLSRRQLKANMQEQSLVFQEGVAGHATASAVPASDPVSGMIVAMLAGKSKIACKFYALG